MTVAIRAGTYRDVPCMVLENENLRVQVIPLSGGKIQSIVDKRSQREILYQTDRATFLRPYYGMPFDEGDLSGFDDMFPTISACQHPDAPWQEVCLPDHGEVWSLPWDCSVEGDALALACDGVRLPYRLIKRISFSKADTLMIRYCAQNRSAFPLRFIWAAHPLVQADESSLVLLPKETERIFHTYDGPNRPDAFGRIGYWSEERAQYGVIADPGEERCGKFYVLDKLRSNESAVYSSETRQYVKFRAPAAQVPYLGVWLNWNGYAVRQQNIALEPCTGAPDAIDAAKRFGWISELAPHGAYEWTLEIETGSADGWEGILPETGGASDATKDC